MSSLAAWTEAANQCQLDDLQLSLLHMLACRLASLHDGDLGNTLAASRALLQCDSSTLVQLIAVLTHAGFKAASVYSRKLREYASSQASLALAVAAAARTGSFDWTLMHFSQQIAEAGQRVMSPWFSAVGE